MASAGGKSSTGSGKLPKSRAVPGTEKELQHLQVMEKRRIRKIIKNRRSARRAWMRKHEAADDLKPLVNRLNEENKELRGKLSKTYEPYFKEATENSFFRLLASNYEVVSYSFSPSSNGFYKTKPAVNLEECDQLIEEYYK